MVCSPVRHADLFRAVLAGLGQSAIITRATLRLLPAPATVRHYQLYYPSVAALTADQRRVVRDGRFGYVEGQIVAPSGTSGWGHMLEAVAFPDGATPPDDAALLGDLSYQRGTEQIQNLAYFDFLNRLAPGVAYLESIGEWYRPHPWWNAFLPDSQADTFVSSVIKDLTTADIGASGVILLYPFRRSRLHLPLLRLPEEDLVFLFAVLRTASSGAAGPGTMLDANRTLYRRARALGGFQYPVGSIPTTHGDWRSHFGPYWPALVAARHRYDPDAILTPGQGIFD
jgi:FAD/FMN-containing dehydrogenase